MTSTAAQSTVETVDAIVPLRNESAYIRTLINQLRRQTLDLRKIFLVVAPSEDDSFELCQAAARDDDRIVVLPNPGHTAPCAMNEALPLVAADAWVRIDGHQEIPDDLVETLRRVMNETGAACVGPLTDSVSERPDTAQHGIALAMASKWGVGNARFRTGAGGSGEVDAVAYGLYRRSITDRVGLFNTAMTRNQDDEYNTRLRRLGGRIWLTSDVAVRYYPRPTLGRLADQYRQYGQWRVIGTLVFGNELRPRQLVPPMLVLAAAGSMAAGRRAPRIPATLGTAYGAVLVAQVIEARRRGVSYKAALLSASAIATMHWSYGLGFWHGLASAVYRRAALRASADGGEFSA